MGGGARNDAGDGVAVAAKVFRGRMQHQVDAMRDRFLEHRRRPGIIDGGDDTLLLGQPRQMRDVLQLEHHRGRAFQVEQLGAGKCRRDRIRVGTVDVVDLDVEPRQQPLEQPIGIAIAIAHRHDALARTDKGKHRGADRRHATGKAARGFSALKCGHARLELHHRRIVATRIDRLLSFAGKGIGHLRVVGEGEQRGLVDRRHHRTAGERFVMRQQCRRLGKIVVIETGWMLVHVWLESLSLAAPRFRSSSTVAISLSASARAPCGSRAAMRS